jgi:hypothetical protein
LIPQPVYGPSTKWATSTAKPIGTGASAATVDPGLCWCGRVYDCGRVHGQCRSGHAGALPVSVCDVIKVRRES